MWWHGLLVVWLTTVEVCLAIHLPSTNEAASSALSYERGRRGRRGGKALVQVLGEETAFLDLSRQGGRHHSHHASSAAGAGRAAAWASSHRRSRSSSHGVDPKDNLEVLDVDMEDGDGVEDSATSPKGQGRHEKEDRSHLEQDFEALPGLAAEAWHWMLREPAVGAAGSRGNKNASAGAAAPAEAIRLDSQPAEPATSSSDAATTTEAPLPVADDSDWSPGGFRWGYPPFLKRIPVPQSITFPRRRTLPWACQTTSCKLARFGMSVVLVTAVMAFVCCLNCVLT